MQLPQRSFIFPDLRHVRCGDLRWRSKTGETLPLVPPAAPEEALAGTGFVPHGVRLQAQVATKSDEPLQTSPPGRVIHDGGIYRSWALEATYPTGPMYAARDPRASASVVIRYAESSDGYDWKELRRSPLEVPEQAGFDGATFFLDPKCPPEERYKIIYCARPPRKERAGIWAKYRALHPRYRDCRINENHLGCMYVATSPDGLHWRPVPEPLMVHLSDTDTTVYYDSWLDRYVMYTRLYNQ